MPYEHFPGVPCLGVHNSDVLNPKITKLSGRVVELSGGASIQLWWLGMHWGPFYNILNGQDIKIKMKPECTSMDWMKLL